MTAALLSALILVTFVCVFMPVCARQLSQEVRRQLSRISSVFPLSGLQGRNSADQTWWQASSCPEPLRQSPISAFWSVLKSCLLFEISLLSPFDLLGENSGETQKVVQKRGGVCYKVRHDTVRNESDQRFKRWLLCQPTFLCRLYSISKFFRTDRQLFLRGFCPSNWQAPSDWLVHERAMVYLCSLPESLG